MAAAVALVVAACGPGGGTTPAGVQLEVTKDFGATPLRQLNAPHLSGAETVMSLLLRNEHVTTRYSGGFVQSIDGRAGGVVAGHRYDWFYYVNGVQASKGAAATRVRPGDRIWWDYHDWSATENVPAVVGSYPEPFLRGIGGNRQPLRLECAPPSSAACRIASRRLRAVGAAPFPSELGGVEEMHSLRVLVGTYSALKVDPAVAELGSGPAGDGVYARFSRDGSTLSVLDPEGHVARGLIGNVGLVAAATFNGSDPIWIVTGTDAAGVQAAASALLPAVLHDRFALVVDGPVQIPAPLARSG
jgi:hypothetical protein